MDPAAALALLARAPVVHLATTRPDGAPVLRAVHAAVVDGCVAFHGARTGEKAGCLGRPAVVAAEEVHASIPSWFIDPENAAVAGTFFESAQVHGTLAAVDAPGDRARVLEALMLKYQPEGRHRPVRAEDPFYAAELRATLVVRVVPERIEGKAKLGQNRSPEVLARILDRLADRGLPGDCRAIARVRALVPALAGHVPPRAAQAASLEEVRAAVDRLDRGIVPLLATRARWVEAAATFKRNDDEARAPARVEQIIAKVRALAVAEGAPEAVVEETYRAMIAAFVALERARLRG